MFCDELRKEQRSDTHDNNDISGCAGDGNDYRSDKGWRLDKGGNDNN
jgi:hypothetical protein